MQQVCSTQLDGLAFAAANAYQHDMPLCSRPYLAMARQLGCTEHELIECLSELKRGGILSRVGPVFDHRQAGASTLAALAVPAHALDAVAAVISLYREVNHNYRRSHHYNLWFVITAPSRQRIDEILHEIEMTTGLQPLDLPMLHAFRLDLGFPLGATP